MHTSFVERRASERGVARRPRSTERRRQTSGGECSDIESASRKRTSAPVQSFDGRRLGSKRAVGLFTRANGGSDLGRHIVDSSRTTPRGGAIDGTVTGASDGPTSRSHAGRERPRAASEERMPGDRPRSSRSGSAWGAVKHAMHPFSTRASVASGAARRRRIEGDERRKAFVVAGRDAIVSARFDGVDGRRRLHVPLAVCPGSRKRSWGRGDAEARWQSARKARHVRGLVARRRSLRVDARANETRIAANGCAGPRCSWRHSCGRALTKERFGVLSCDTVEGVPVWSAWALTQPP